MQTRGTLGGPSGCLRSAFPRRLRLPAGRRLLTGREFLRLDERAEGPLDVAVAEGVSHRIVGDALAIAAMIIPWSSASTMSDTTPLETFTESLNPYSP